MLSSVRYPAALPRPSPVLFLIALSVSMIRCAGQLPPGGGPPDTTPPVVVQTRPDSNAVHVRTQSIEVHFNEYVDRNSTEESIFISPYLGPLEFEWSGPSVTVRFADSLKKNTTYVLTVGTDVKDLRAGNRMQSSYALAFSTGDSIDSGSIAGRVFDESPEGVMVFAFRLRNVLPDTLDPGSVKPDYVTQTGKNGSFTLSHLALGPYRVVAVRDQYRDLLYGREVDQYGVTAGDLDLDNTSPSVRNVYFRLTREDTTRPFLTKAEALNSRLIQLRFSEAMDSTSFGRTDIQLSDTTTGRSLSVLTSSLNMTSPHLAWMLMGTAIEEDHIYRVAVRNVFDRAGNGIDTANASAVFEGTDTPDTVMPGISVPGIRDSSRGYPPAKPLLILFSEPVPSAPLTGVLLLRTVDSTRVPADIRWRDPASIAVVPREALLPAAWYQLQVRLDAIVDLFGNRYADSTYTLRFQTRDPRTTGSVDGRVVDSRENPPMHPIYVIAHDIDHSSAEDSRIRLEHPGVFRFGSLPESRYRMSAFIDADSSGEYSFGRIYPFIPAERFTVVSDTLKVRARWDVEGVLVQFR
jgi:hypothetical protein